MLAFALKGLLLALPDPPAQVRSGQFDTDRALSRLGRILGDQRPHPVDTAADDAVRDRILQELRTIGLRPVVHESADCAAMPHTRVVRCAKVRNVVATIPGRTAGPHLLLDAHYDSTPAGPGAGDDGIGVATLLEVASVLNAGPPPARPVTFLFNEGEEFGLNGSSAFVHADPLAREVGTVINIDARGVSGPATMFETNDPNGAAITIFAKGGGRPFANSISTDFAKLIPNTTDAVEFKPRGWKLLNFAIIGNETRYHTPGDTVGALSRPTVSHMGQQVLAATHAALASPVAANASSTFVFTDIAGRILVRLPLPVAAGMLAVLLMASIYLTWRTKAPRRLPAVASTVVGGVAVAAVLSLLAGLIRPGDFWRAYPLVSYLGVYSALLAAMAVIWGKVGSDSDPRRNRAAAWLLVLLLGSITSLLLPGATIFFIFAPAVALVGVALSNRAPRIATVFTVSAILLQLLMFGELLALIEMLLVDGPLWAVAPLAALAALPVLAELHRTDMKGAAALMMVGALGLWSAALLLPRSSPDRLAQFTIDYFHDADGNRSMWAIATKQAPLPAGYPGAWMKGVLAYNGRTRWVSPAPIVSTPVPALQITSDEAVAQGRKVTFQLDGSGAESLSIRFAKGTKLLAMGIAGKALPVPARGTPEKAVLGCSGRSCSTLVLEAVFADRTPVQAELFSYRNALPSEAQPLLAARPRQAVPQYSTDQTVTMKRISF